MADQIIRGYTARNTLHSWTLVREDGTSAVLLELTDFQITTAPHGNFIGCNVELWVELELRRAVREIGDVDDVDWDEVEI